MFIANLVRLVCIPYLFRYRCNFGRPGKQLLEFFPFFLTYCLQYHCFLFSAQKNFTHERALDLPDYICGNQYDDVFVFAYVLYCIRVCAALYLYLWQPMMMERGLWNFVYPHLSKSGHSIAMHWITIIVQHIHSHKTRHTKQNTIQTLFKTL